MGKKIPIVSFLCGVITGRKKPTPAIEDAEDSSDSTSDPARSPDDDTTKLDGDESPEQLQLPPPPGSGHHMRTVSCQHTRSNSGVSKLVSSLSLRVMGGSGGGGGGGLVGAVREEKSRHKEKKMFKHEDSVWKKTIILGEKCRIPDEEEQDILYDEKGNKIFTYHPKTHSSMLPFSRQTSFNGKDQLSKR